MDELSKIVEKPPKGEEDNREARAFDAKKGEHDLKSQSLAHGWIGKCFGDKYHAPTNFIGIIAFGALVILSIYAFKGYHLTTHDTVAPTKVPGHDREFKSWKMISDCSL
ncbi:MAG: hypothetical protein OXF20_13935 [Gammaproteobacteria bacterium]|nr:hypothetical protein [Gammaproteobacteria bacterium]